MDIDEALLNVEDLKQEMGGSTAIVTLIKDNKLYCANAGDSRAIACVNGHVSIYFGFPHPSNVASSNASHFISLQKSLALSVDHKPILPIEMQRIHESGGWVENCRVNGSLALSRALGDFKFKQNKKLKAERQIVTAYPDVEVHDLDESWDFILLASDGIWDVLSNDDVVELCLKKFEKCIPPEQICEEIMTECLSPDLLMTGTDNMTIVLTCFLHGQSYEAFCKRAAEYVQRLYPQSNKYHLDETLENGTALSPMRLLCEPNESPFADENAAVINDDSDDSDANEPISNGGGNEKNEENEACDNDNSNCTEENGQDDTADSDPA